MSCAPPEPALNAGVHRIELAKPIACAFMTVQIRFYDTQRFPAARKPSGRRQA
jgi:hypothetical protein